MLDEMLQGSQEPRAPRAYLSSLADYVDGDQPMQPIESGLSYTSLDRGRGNGGGEDYEHGSALEDLLGGRRNIQKGLDYLLNAAGGVKGSVYAYRQERPVLTDEQRMAEHLKSQYGDKPVIDSAEQMEHKVGAMLLQMQARQGDTSLNGLSPEEEIGDKVLVTQARDMVAKGTAGGVTPESLQWAGGYLRKHAKDQADAIAKSESIRAQSATGPADYMKRVGELKERGFSDEAVAQIMHSGQWDADAVKSADLTRLDDEIEIAAMSGEFEKGSRLLMAKGTMLKQGLGSPDVNIRPYDVFMNELAHKRAAGSGVDAFQMGATNAIVSTYRGMMRLAGTLPPASVERDILETYAQAAMEERPVAAGAGNVVGSMMDPVFFGVNAALGAAIPVSVAAKNAFFLRAVEAGVPRAIAKTQAAALTGEGLFIDGLQRFFGRSWGLTNPVIAKSAARVVWGAVSGAVTEAGAVAIQEGSEEMSPASRALSMLQGAGHGAMLGMLLSGAHSGLEAGIPRIQRAVRSMFSKANPDMPASVGKAFDNAIEYSLKGLHGEEVKPDLEKAIDVLARARKGLGRPLGEHETRIALEESGLSLDHFRDLKVEEHADIVKGVQETEARLADPNLKAEERAALVKQWEKAQRLLAEVHETAGEPAMAQKAPTEDQINTRLREQMREELPDDKLLDRLHELDTQATESSGLKGEPLDEYKLLMGEMIDRNLQSDFSLRTVGEIEGPRNDFQAKRWESRRSAMLRSEERKSTARAAEARKTQKPRQMTREEVHRGFEESFNLDKDQSNAVNALLEANAQVAVRRGLAKTPEEHYARTWSGIQKGGRASKEALHQIKMEVSEPQMMAAIEKAHPDSAPLIRDMVRSEKGGFVEADVPVEAFDFSDIQKRVKGEAGVEGDNLSPAKIKAYAQLSPETMSPVVSLTSPTDSGKLYIVDGRHRVLAAALARKQGAGKGTVRAFVPKDWAEARFGPMEDSAALHQRKGEGGGKIAASVEFLEDGRALVRAFEQGDITSALHEVGHVFRRQLDEGDLRIAETWAGVEDGAWTRKAEEKFARGWERYLRDGEAPLPALKRVFEQLKTWFTSVYRSVRGGPLNETIAPEMRKVFDKLLGGEADQTVAKSVPPGSDIPGGVKSENAGALPSDSSRPDLAQTITKSIRGEGLPPPEARPATLQLTPEEAATEGYTPIGEPGPRAAIETQAAALTKAGQDVVLVPAEDGFFRIAQPGEAAPTPPARGSPALEPTSDAPKGPIDSGASTAKLSQAEKLRANPDVIRWAKEKGLDLALLSNTALQNQVPKHLKPEGVPLTTIHDTPEPIANVAARELRPGWTLDHVSESGSAYLKHEASGRVVRLSDHHVPDPDGSRETAQPWDYESNLVSRSGRFSGDEIRKAMQRIEGEEAGASAVARGRKLSPDAATRLASAVGGDLSLSEAFYTKAKSDRMLASLISSEVFTRDDLIGLTDSNGLLTQAGRETVERALVSAAIPDAARVGRASAGQRQTLVRSLPAITKLRSIPEGAGSEGGVGFDRTLGHAMDVLDDYRKSGASSIDELIGETSMEPQPWRQNPHAIEMARAMLEDTPAEFSAKMNRLAGIGGEDVKPESFEAVFGKTQEIDPDSGQMFDFANPAKAPPGGPGADSPYIPTARIEGAAEGALAFRDVVRPVPMPELVKLARAIGIDPTIRKIQKGARGAFGFKAGEEYLHIAPDTAKNPDGLAKTLAHEIGHLVDYMDDKTMGRGNLLGRVLSLKPMLSNLKTLRGFMANTFPLAGATNAELRSELVGLTDWWKPYNKAIAHGAYVKYRESAPELYADALSVLLNSPGLLKEKAPKFYTELFTFIYRKPEVLKAYNDVQDLLAGRSEDIIAARRADFREDFSAGEEIMKARAQENRAADQSVVEWVNQMLFDTASPIIRREKIAAKRGEPLAQRRIAQIAMEEFALRDNAARVTLGKVQREVYQPMLDADINKMDAGEYLAMKRIAAGDRQAFGNPRGHTPETASQQLADLERSLGPEKWRTLTASMERYQDLMFKVVEDGVDEGIYSRKTFDETIAPNKGMYATFAVLDHLEDYIPAAIRQQIGTFKGIANPFDATLMKTVSLHRAIELNRAKRVALVDGIQSWFPGEVTLHRPGPGIEPPRAKAGYEPLTYMVDGRPAYLEVDQYVAKAFQSSDVGVLGRIGRMISRPVYAVFHPLYVTFSPSFAVSNITRDLKRTYTGLVGLGHQTPSIGEVFGAYWRAKDSAWRRATDKYDPIVERMLEDRALAIPFSKYDPLDESVGYEKLLRAAGLVDTKDWLTKVGTIFKPLEHTLRFAQRLSDFTEALPKIATYNLLGEKGVGDAQRSYIVRNYVGTPNTARRGLATNLTNGLFMYSNVTLQGMRADAELALSPKTRGGYWLRSMLVDFLPKMAMRAAAYGAFGTAVKKIFDMIPSYDKATYTVIPVGTTTQNGEEKAVYFRIPHGDAQRPLAAIAWYLSEGKLAKGAAEAFGQVPSANPYLQMGSKWVDYAQGHNPYDDFRNRDIVGREAWAAGGWDSARDMFSYTANQFGIASTVMHWVTGEPGRKDLTTTERVLGSIPGLERVIKISDRGLSEKEWEAVDLEDQEKARFKLGLPGNVRPLLSERYRLQRLKGALDGDFKPADKARLIELAGWYKDVYLPLTKGMKEAQEMKRDAEYKRGRAYLEAATDRVVKNR